MFIAKHDNILAVDQIGGKDVLTLKAYVNADSMDWNLMYALLKDGAYYIYNDLTSLFQGLSKDLINEFVTSVFYDNASLEAYLGGYIYINAFEESFNGSITQDMFLNGNTIEVEVEADDYILTLSNDNNFEFVGVVNKADTNYKYIFIYQF